LTGLGNPAVVRGEFFLTTASQSDTNDQRDRWSYDLLAGSRSDGGMSGSERKADDPQPVVNDDVPAKSAFALWTLNQLSDSTGGAGCGSAGTSSGSSVCSGIAVLPAGNMLRPSQSGYLQSLGILIPISPPPLELLDPPRT